MCNSAILTPCCILPLTLFLDRAQLSANGVPEGNNIPSNVKAGLTRQYNKTHLAAQKLSKGSAGGGVGGRFNEDGIAVDDDPEDEEVSAPIGHTRWAWALAQAQERQIMLHCARMPRAVQLNA